LAILDPVARTWKEYPLATGGALPAGIAVDSQDNIWFTEFSGNKIGLLLSGHTNVAEFPIPTSNSGPEDIHIIGGKVWFTEQYGNKVANISVGILPPH
jgi:virginiamycin B lyase